MCSRLRGRGQRPLGHRGGTDSHSVPSQNRVLLVGPSKRFLSGIAYYTYGLANALETECDLAVLLIRKLLPKVLYPGGRRVGHQLSNIQLPAAVPVFDGVDYYWGPSFVGAVNFMRNERPDVVVLQWWTATVLHTYVALSVMARLRGAKIVVEFHETLDSAENRYWLIAAYANTVAPRLFRSCAGYVVHSEHERAAVVGRYGLDARRCGVIHHPVYDHQRGTARTRSAPEGVCNVLFFGLIRPVKGLDELISAMGLVCGEETNHYWLTIVGETWEGCGPVLETARNTTFGSRTTIVNRYVTDLEADGYFRGADVVVLPYRSSAQSGVLHLAMGYGLPVVVTRVGGLLEVAARYPGAVLVDVGSPALLLDGIRRARELPRGGFVYGERWVDSARAYRQFLQQLVSDSEQSSLGISTPASSLSR